MKPFRLPLVLLCAVLPALLTVDSSAVTFQQIKYPNANSTSANGINDSGEIVGFYQDVNNIYHGYTLLNGTYTTFDPAGSTSTLLGGVNNNGVIVGSYSTTGKTMGFIDRGGQITNVIYPNPKEEQTECWAINNKGVVVGLYSVRNTQNELLTFGFILQNGKFTRLQFPGANNTLPNGINDSGLVTGTYTDSNGTTNGFTYLNGNYTRVSYPGAAGASSASDTNDAGTLIGGYVKNSVGKGFELVKGKYLNIDYPQKNTYTALTGINKQGDIVGNFGSGTSPSTTGFLRTP